jgi:hypothetical protein
MADRSPENPQDLRILVRIVSACTIQPKPQFRPRLSGFQHWCCALHWPVLNLPASSRPAGFLAAPGRAVPICDGIDGSGPECCTASIAVRFFWSSP